MDSFSTSLSLSPALDSSKTRSVKTEVPEIAFSLGNASISTPDPKDMNSSSLPTMPVNEEALLLWRIAGVLDFWVPPFLFFIGTFANVLVIVVMRGKHFRHMSTSFYMAVSAVVDIVSLQVPLPVHYLYVNFPHIFDNIRQAHVLCTICHTTGWMADNLGVFLTVAMTVDRSLAIQFPLQAPSLCTVRRAKMATLCLLLLVLLMDGHVAFTTRMVSKEVLAYLCAVDTSFSESYRIFHDVYWPYLHNVSLMLSFAIIIVGNIIIILHVKRSEDSKDMGQGSKSSGGSEPGKTSSSSSKSRHLSLMLIIDSASIIAFMLPMTVYMLLDQSFQDLDLFNNSPINQARQGLLFATGFYLIQVNHSANFFLYCLSGARFREALKQALFGKPGQRSNRIFNILSTRKGNSASVASQ